MPCQKRRVNAKPKRRGRGQGPKAYASSIDGPEGAGHQMVR